MTLKILTQKIIYINALRCTAIWKQSSATGACRGQMKVLHYILEHPGCGQKEIAERMYISPAAVADVCKRLEQEALISREVHPDNRRCKVLMATEKGVQADRRHEEVFKKVDADTFANMSEEELTALDTLLSKILDNLGGNQEDPLKVFASLERKDIKEVQ